MSQSDPVKNPTWYANIRHMFNDGDIACMKDHGIYLDDYNSVKSNANNIYGQVSTGNMPPGNPWDKDKAQTFLNWLINNCPKGVPQVQMFKAAARTLSTATRVRKEINSLTDAELKKVIKAFKGIMSLDPSDPNSYFVQAGWHWLPEPATDCQHHVPAYNPWHRAYLMSFENALRTIDGCEDVTLPYWDITTSFPEVLKKEPFNAYTLPKGVGDGFRKGYTTSRYSYDTIAANLLRYDVTADINRAMTKTDWEDFHGFWSNAPYNTIIAAHDGGHGSIGTTMRNTAVAAFDPIFWFFHANWDRLFWNWQKQMQATTLEGLLTTIDQKTDPTSYQIFTIPVLQTLKPFSEKPLELTTVSIIDSVNSLDVDYADPVQFTALDMSPKSLRSTASTEKFSVNTQLVNVRVKGVNRLNIPGSFSVHLTRDDEVIASKAMFQPNEVGKCPNCVENPVVHFDFEMPLEEISKGKLGIKVEPFDEKFSGENFPHDKMGNPTVDIHFMLDHD